jgi:ribosomal-protein-alanine N-acetyltransferase
MATAESRSLNTELSVLIEPMTEHDLLEVCQIEESSELSAWGWDAYHNELQSPHDSVMLVARVDSSFHGVGIAGFIVARAIADELHVNSVAVRPEFRGRHIGATLLRMALEQGKQRGAVIARLEVRAGNQAAQGLYRHCGFEADGRRKNYYRGPTEDALLMSVSLAGG